MYREAPLVSGLVARPAFLMPFTRRATEPGLLLVPGLQAIQGCLLRSSVVHKETEA